MKRKKKVIWTLIILACLLGIIVLENNTKPTRCCKPEECIDIGCYRGSGSGSGLCSGLCKINLTTDKNE